MQWRSLTNGRRMRGTLRDWSSALARPVSLCSTLYRLQNAGASLTSCSESLESSLPLGKNDQSTNIFQSLTRKRWERCSYRCILSEEGALKVLWEQGAERNILTHETTFFSKYFYSDEIKGNGTDRTDMGGWKMHTVFNLKTLREGNTWRKRRKRRIILKLI